jgi:hypothetical protein
VANTVDQFPKTREENRIHRKMKSHDVGSLVSLLSNKHRLHVKNEAFDDVVKVRVSQLESSCVMA